jgi:hypothetical protein
VAAVAADIVRALQLTAVAAFTEGFDPQRIMRTAHAATAGRYFSLGDSHGGTNSSNNTFVHAARPKTIDAVILEGRPYGKEGLRTSSSRCAHSLACNGGKAGAIAENSRVATRLAAP